MNFRLQPGEPLQTAAQRITREQIASVHTEFSNHPPGHVATVHMGRVTCKRLRALLRLIRPGLRTSYLAQDQALRIAARHLAGQREASVYVKTFARLTDRFSSRFSNRLLEDIADKLAQDIQPPDDAALNQRTDDFTSAMNSFLHQSLAWSWRKKAGLDSLELGFAQTYSKGRKATKGVLENPSTERLHDLRKWVKYHGFQLALLQEFDLPQQKRRVTQAGRLEKMLGRSHDLDGLRNRIAGFEFPEDDSREVKKLLKSIDRKRRKLQKRAVAMAKLLYKQPVKKMQERVRKRMGKASKS